ncbi:alpha/beta hydrolase [Catellatospora sp. NPDC049133]|uniref:RBBP9/YdeN family alpha/beta hydrolase n=1 Tax=Catellatospora sp. NPDC049133 TaxID=3155499 RepID=UPI0033FBB07D
MTRHLLVPGRGVPLPEHWQRRWADAHPEYRWAPYPPGPPFTLDERVAALHEAVTADDEPVVLIAHSAGCITTVVWAARHVGPVRAALLVTPPYLDPEWRPGPGETNDFVSVAVPRERLPFRTVLVASRTDPYTTFPQFERYAADWGAELYDAGDVGHVETASGHGPWPDGERLVAALG